MKLLVLLSRVPYPLEKGDKLRAYYQLRELSKKHEICLCMLTDEDVSDTSIAEIEKISAEHHIFRLSKPGIAANLIYAFLRGLPFQIGYFYNPKIHRSLLEIVDRFQPDHLFAQLIRTTEYVRNINGIPKSLDYMDVFSKGVERRIQKASWFLRPIFSLESKRLRQYEKSVFADFDQHFIITSQDRDAISHTRKEEVTVIPNGIDFDFFSPQEMEVQYDLVFTGNMSYPPNVDAARYMAKEVLPLLIEKHPDLKVRLAGINPAPSVKALESENVEVSGYIEDIRTAYNSAKVFVAPMQIGTGLQNKLLEAMASGIPAVTTPLANNALGAENGKEILVGNSSKELAESIDRLLTDEKLRKNIASNARDFILSRFSWKNACNQMESLMIAKSNKN